ncbi:hypothetical protein BOX15_Mlig005235g1 [Macrostomum lignano]|uniref:non-specific serine/threonine protein kinase n=2 Tax=Macrostomum lignano TaxID=282301 RepID=A0A267H9J6_9PLAT|nr:hypothetical protein BOX15_Mlig005235g1 [Macrostomum lignano]
MAEGRSDRDFRNFMAEKKGELEKFYSKLESMVASEQAKKVIADKDKMIDVIRALQVLMNDHYGDMESLQLNEPQLAKHREQVSQLMAKRPKLLEGLSRLCVEIYKVQADACFCKHQLEAVNKVHSYLLYFVTGNFHNLSDSSLEFCLALSRIEFLFNDFVKPMLSNWYEKHDSIEGCRHAVTASIGFTYNMLYRNNPEIYKVLSGLMVAAPVIPYLQSPILHVQTQALVLIAFALDETKASMFGSAREAMEFLVNCLSEALDSVKRRAEGYHVSELTICLNRLALNDANKRLFVQLRLLPVLRRMCTGDRDDDVVSALDILCTLSHLAENRPLIEQQFLDILAKLFTSSQPNSKTGGLLRNYCSMQGLDRNLGGRVSAAGVKAAQRTPELACFIEAFKRLHADAAPEAVSPDPPRRPQRQPSPPPQQSPRQSPVDDAPEMDASFTTWDFVLEDNKKKVIGSGGFGKVFQAITDRHQFVAVKVIKPLMQMTPEAQRKIFEMERRALELLSTVRHRNVVRFLRAEEQSGKYFIFCELLSGCTIEQLMTRRGTPIDEDGIRKFIGQTCSALSHLHGLARPILHRDIKSSNLMLTYSGTVKLIDFGFAREIATSQMVTHQQCGTPHFMAPEILTAEDAVVYTAKTDVWAVGCTAFEMATGSPPNSDVRQMFRLAILISSKPMPQLPGSVASSLRDFYRVCVQQQPGDRPSASELLRHRFLAC